MEISPEIKRSRKPLYFVIALLIVIAGGAGAYVYISSPSSNRAPVNPTPIVSPAEAIQNPVQYFYQHFSAKDYRVKMLDEKNEGYLFTYEKGELVRVDGQTKYNSQTSSIIKNGKLFSIDHANKTFVEMDAKSGQGNYAIALFKVGTILDPILQGETPTATPWLLVSDRSDTGVLEYETKGRKFMSMVLPGDTGLVDIKIVLDTHTGLITSTSMKSPKNTTWKMLNFQYEEVNDIASVKNFPRDYKKVDPL